MENSVYPDQEQSDLGLLYLLKPIYLGPAVMALSNQTLSHRQVWIIRTFNGCEVQIENSVTRVTVRHHEPHRLMPNSYPEWRNFQFAPNNH